MGTDNRVTLTYIVPAHNSSQIIEGTLKELRDRFAGQPVEIAVVENGSRDDTAEVLRRVESEWDDSDVRLRILTSPKGLGNALRHGIAESHGERIFFGADDLPFGFGDLDAAERFDHTTHKVVIGSKAHPASEVGRGMLRAILTFGFLTARRLILNMRTRDPQGTFILDGDWTRSVAPQLREEGFLLTTELTYLAERNGIKPVEVPVQLSAAHAAHSSRIKLDDVWKMGLGLLTIRKRHRKAKA
jgi:glycosyltransferase involved in cell wall biosynthesis